MLAVLGAGLVAVGAGGTLQEDLTIPGTESQHGLDVLERQFPEVAGTSGQVLFRAPAGEQLRDYRGQVRAVLDRVERVEHVVLATDPFSRQQRLQFDI